MVGFWVFEDRAHQFTDELNVVCEKRESVISKAFDLSNKRDRVPIS